MNDAIFMLKKKDEMIRRISSFNEVCTLFMHTLRFKCTLVYADQYSHINMIDQKIEAKVKALNISHYIRLQIEQITNMLHQIENNVIAASTQVESDVEKQSLTYDHSRKDHECNNF
jgi:hypothetical protein